MLAIERHRDPKLNREFERLFVDGAIDHEEKVFAELMEAGLIERRDPHILAMRFYTPIFYLLQKYDMRPSEVKTAKEELRIIVEEFCSTYMQKPGVQGAAASDIGERMERAREFAGRKADMRKADGPKTDARKLGANKQGKELHTLKTDTQKLNAQKGERKP